MHDESGAKAFLGIPGDLRLQVVISFGYPDRTAPRLVEGKPLEQGLTHLACKPLEKIVFWERYSGQ